MAFLNKLTSLAQNAMDSTKDMLDVNRLNSNISTEKAKIAELKGKIGEYYYTLYASGEVLADEPSGVCMEIKAHEEKIASLEAEIQEKKLEAQRASETAKAARTAQDAQSNATDMFACPACGAANPLTSKFCKECGSPIEVQPIEKPMFCSACGAKNPPGTKFCGGCGNRLDA